MTNNYFVNPLIDLIEILKSEKGCPWDRKQTPLSLGKYLVEESLEAYEAINLNKIENIREELGDVLFQLCFIILLYQEKGLFSFEEVVKKSAAKMKFRHPHVFLDEKADNIEDVEKIWEKAKILEKSNAFISVMDKISSGLPALMKAHKISLKAVNCGFEWENIDGIFDKIYEEIDELKETFEKDLDLEKKEMEFGDLLFTIVNAGRFLGLESEASLLKSCDKFVKRFKWMEKQALSQGKDISLIERNSLEELWNYSKKIYS
ncbi:MAG: nucleoside triphosphate pyrophosphohydrolase [Desulforegulaceae bacterium]|nr:nucleoside triphosphate pyrophosphohydrolase [Desulforegulaceae bacterium]